MECNTNDHCVCQGLTRKKETNLGTANTRHLVQKLGRVVLGDLRRQRGTCPLTEEEATVTERGGGRREPPAKAWGSCTGLQWGRPSHLGALEEDGSLFHRRPRQGQRKGHILPSFSLQTPPAQPWWEAGGKASWQRGFL